tara:strand:+ start:5581 stop:5811 length:231 start_codon:yes stop_codon:yes gene_type:complete
MNDESYSIKNVGVSVGDLIKVNTCTVEQPMEIPRSDETLTISFSHALAEINHKIGGVIVEFCFGNKLRFVKEVTDD